MATIETKIAKNETLICKFNGKRVAWHNALAELENNPVGTVVAGNGHSYTCITNNVPAPEGLTYETGYLFEDENGNRYIFDNPAFAIRAIAYNNVDEYAVTQDATVEETAIVEAEIVEVKTASEMKAAYAASRAVVRVHFTAKGNPAWKLIYHYGLHDRETGYQRISKKEAADELANFGLTPEQIIAVEKAKEDNKVTYLKALDMVFGEDEPATVEEPTHAEEPAIVETANVENATAEAVEVNVEKATFAVGKTYVSDWETEYTVIKRTAKTVTIVPVIYVDDYEDISENPFVKTRRIHSDNNGEILSFNGSEGEALINAGVVITIRATDEVKSEAPAVEEPAAEVNEEVTHLQEKSTDISAQLVKLVAVKNVLTDAEYNAKAGELKDNLRYTTLQIDATNAEDDFDYVAAAEHIENVYVDAQNFIDYNVRENGLTQEQCENIYVTVYTQCEFGKPDYELIDRLVEECKQANAEPDGYNPDVFSLLPKREDLNDVDGEFDEDAAEYTDRDDRYNRGEKIAEGLTAKLRAFDPTVEVTFAIDDDEDTYYLSYDGIARTPFTATGVEASFHAMKQYDAETDCPPELPTPKPNSPFDIARGLNDVFQKTFHRVDAPYLDVLTQDGAKIVTNFGATFISVDWRATDGYVFGNHFNDVLARYETPEQVTDVMTALRDAIKRGDTEFAFPPVEELTAPPEPETPATAVEETDRERFLKASEYVITSPGRYLGTDKFGEDRFAVTWKTRCPLRKINKATARNILATFGLTPETYLAEKAKWVAAEIKRGSRQFAIDMQAEFLRDKIAADRKASVELMPALYPSDDSDDDELIDTPEVKAPADEFTAKLAAFDAEITHAETAEIAAKAAYDRAVVATENAIAARQDFLDKTAGDLTRKLHETCVGNDFIETATVSGCPVTIGDFDNVYVDATLGGKFKFVTFNNRELARYDTPAQVETVIGKLKDAVERHKPVFHFPTVDELIDPPVEPVDAAHISDSLTRAMKTAMEKFQEFCLVKNLTAAENELKLYNICREATRELWEVN